MEKSGIIRKLSSIALLMGHLGFMEGTFLSRYGSDLDEPNEGQQVKARLKWFNATKGFGFVSPVDGNSDAFLHVSVLHRAGLQSLGDQAELLCEVGSGPKGPQVTRIVEVLDPGVAGAASGASGSGMPRGIEAYGYARQPAMADARGAIDSYSATPRNNADRADGYDQIAGAEEQVSGTVKWFKADKGFGFITIDASGHDVFVHKSVLQRSGVGGLEAGQRVEMRVHEVEKGREAVWVAVL